MWFAASLFFEGVHAGAKRADNLWEERVVLIEADDESIASEVAQTIGAGGEVSYAVHGSDNLRWTFRAVSRVYSIDATKLVHGCELFSRFMTGREAVSLQMPMPDE